MHFLIYLVAFYLRSVALLGRQVGRTLAPCVSVDRRVPFYRQRDRFRRHFPFAVAALRLLFAAISVSV